MNEFLLSLSRSVIGYGIEEEDRLDQWTEDAESVCYHGNHKPHPHQSLPLVYS